MRLIYVLAWFAGLVAVLVVAWRAGHYDVAALAALALFEPADGQS